MKFIKGDRVFIDGLSGDNSLNETYGTVDVVSDGTDTISVKCDEDDIVTDIEKKNLSPDTFHFLLYLVYNLNIKHKVKEKCIRFINPNKEKDKKNAAEEPTEPDNQNFGYDGFQIVKETYV